MGVGITGLWDVWIPYGVQRWLNEGGEEEGDGRGGGRGKEGEDRKGKRAGQGGVRRDYD